MQTTLRAVLGRKIVEYPMNATFIVERSKGKKPFLSSKPNITAALTKFHRAKDEDAGKVRLSACYDGQVTRLL